MDHFDMTTGVLDSWDLLNPLFDTFIDRNKESLQVSSLNLYTSSTSLLLRKTSYYKPVFNSISAGYYPVFGGFYKSCPPTYDKPLVHVTVSPRDHQKSSDNNEVHNKKQYRKKTSNSSDHSLCSKKIYIVVPGTKKDKVYAIETTNAKIFKEINDSKLLSECMIKDYFRTMNKAKKAHSDKAKEKGNQLKTIPECSPGCAYMNMSRTKSASPDRSGSASPRSPVRSSYKPTKVESQQSITTTKTAKSPDRLKVQRDGAKSKSPVRFNGQKAKPAVNQTDNRKQESISPDRFSFISGKRSIESVIASEKRRSPERYEKRTSSPTRGGRIRITGRLGIDQDDKCVLKCNATLNDEPIPTQFQGAACAMLPMCFQAQNEEKVVPIKKRDAMVQAKEKGTRIYSNQIRKESQATQVDFQILYSSTKTRSEQCGRGKVMQQCACVSTDDNLKEVQHGKEVAGNALKKQHSPLIVISVYSKNASEESSGNINQKHVKTTGPKKENKTVRSRSPSPARSPKKLGGKKSENRVAASTSKKTVRETAKKETRSKVNQSESKSGLRSTTVTKRKLESKTNKTSKTQKTPPQSRRSTSPHTKEDENKAELMKRALIEDFTKTYADQINQRNAHLEIPLQTKHNVSNISIDIEGDSDYYNVKFEQDVGKLNTELTVRKANRGDRAGDVIVGGTDTTSLENFLYMPEDEPRKRSFSQSLMFDGTEVTMNSDLGDENELNVKDSIEISHKRELKTSVDRERKDIAKEVGYKKFVPEKHFQGDDCSISDPDARDREIRRLLGIDKGIKKKKTKATKSCDAFEKRSQAPTRSNSTSNTQTTNFAKKDIKDAPNTIVIARPLCLLNCKQNVQLLYHLSVRKPKRIVLSRSQYAKVKRTIFNSPMSKHNNANAPIRRPHNSRLRIVKPEIKNIILHSDKDCQTDDGQIEQRATSDENTYTIQEIDGGDVNSTWRNGEYKSNSDKETIIHEIDGGDVNSTWRNGEYKSNSDKETIIHEIDGGDVKSTWRNGEYKFNSDKETIIHEIDGGDVNSTWRNGEYKSNSDQDTIERSSNVNHDKQVISYNNYYMHNVLRTVYVAKEHNVPITEGLNEEFLKKASSVKDIQCRKVAARQKVRFSSSDSANFISRGYEKKDSCSVHTIFKCHQKSITPNLGTSAYSLCNGEPFGTRIKFFEDSVQNLAPKKPFLKRLISCLVFKVSQASDTKNPRGWLETGSPRSSFDSYHVSTSLGAIEMSSSLYDTTASFYSDHSAPAAKIRRGFFSSVRGLLTRKH